MSIYNKIIPAFVGLILAFPATQNWADALTDQSWQCFSQQISKLARSRLMVSSLEVYNDNPPDPHQLDVQWPVLQEKDCEIKKLIDHPASHRMRDWIQKFSIQGEGLLIGINGGLAAATEKTTDFWQGDEPQFQETLKRPADKHFIQRELYDESSNLMLIKISTPIYGDDPETPIGVLVIGLDTFVIDYLEPCKSLTK